MCKTFLAKSESPVDKNSPCLRMRRTDSQSLILDRVKTGVSLSDSTQQLRCETADVPGFYLTPLDAAGKSPILDVIQNTKAKERAS